ncbi:MAG: hypothetical protein WBW33_24000 [Bryobacteraceae bacterium]
MIKTIHRHVLLAALLMPLLAQVPIAFAQGDEYDAARNMIQHVQDDLHTIQPAGPHQGKDRERIQDALKHLSDLDRHMTKDKFSKGAIDDAIGNVQGILNHNTLETRERDMLNADVHDLRELKLYKGR